MTHAFESPESGSPWRHGSPWGHDSNREGIGGEIANVLGAVFSFIIQQAVHLYLHYILYYNYIMYVNKTFFKNIT